MQNGNGYTPLKPVLSGTLNAQATKIGLVPGTEVTITACKSQGAFGISVAARSDKLPRPVMCINLDRIDVPDAGRQRIVELLALPEFRRRAAAKNNTG